MRLPGRVSAAIEILADIIERHRPASEALKDWGRAHRFAGAGDRHAIGTLVFDTLRHRASAAYRMGSEAPRDLVLATLSSIWGMAPAEIAALADGEHGPTELSAAETAALSRRLGDVPPHAAGEFPEWLTASLMRVFGDDAAHEGAALAQRAPIDLRVNVLKADRDKVLAALQRFGAEPGPLAPTAIRLLPPGPDQKHVSVEAEPAHGMGWFEVQDAASQVAAALTCVKPGERVADICAGAGGKTLALAALMKNEGTVVAHDRDRHRLRPIFERIGRSGATNIEVLAAEDIAKLAEGGGFDCVVADAPCTGTGTWRRKPDAKWRLTDKSLAIRVKEQRDVLTQAAALVKKGGRLAYFTCSVLPEENGDQVKWFLSQHKDFRIIPTAKAWAASSLGGEAPPSADKSSETLLLTPRCHGTDGFFVALLERK
jgi:16S rRNA (cytosine967-C5)-methyltransferase